MTFEGLSGPVGARYVSVEPLQSFDSIQRAATMMREAGLELWPLAVGGQIVGVISAETLTAAMAAGLSPSAPVGAAMSKTLPTITASESAARALRLMSEKEVVALLVTDSQGKYVGLLRATDLAADAVTAPRPRMVGGMATPVGVYLTNGSQNGGAPWWALSLTGATLLVLHVAATLVTHFAFQLPFWRVLPPAVVSSAYGLVSTVLFLVGLRSLPLAGIHAAEHMTVHAIERGEPLDNDVVRRMPRVHPRCGTNLVAGLSIMLAVINLPLADMETRLLLAAILTAILWRPVGSFLQFYVTTKPPSERQLTMGVRAGRELLQKFVMDPVVVPNPARRIWNMGILQIMLGSMLLAGVMHVLAWYVPGFGLLRVYFAP